MHRREKKSPAKEDIFRILVVAPRLVASSGTEEEQEVEEQEVEEQEVEEQDEHGNR
jgi:hypothetical protein